MENMTTGKVLTVGSSDLKRCNMSAVSIFTNFYQFLPLGMKAVDMFYHFYHFYGLESEKEKVNNEIKNPLSFGKIGKNRLFNLIINYLDNDFYFYHRGKNRVKRGKT